MPPDPQMIDLLVHLLFQLNHLSLSSLINGESEVSQADSL